MLQAPTFSGYTPLVLSPTFTRRSQIQPKPQPVRVDLPLD